MTRKADRMKLQFCSGNLSRSKAYQEKMLCIINNGEDFKEEHKVGTKSLGRGAIILSWVAQGRSHNKGYIGQSLEGYKWANHTTDLVPANIN